MIEKTDNLETSPGTETSYSGTIEYNPVVSTSMEEENNNTGERVAGNVSTVSRVPNNETTMLHVVTLSNRKYTEDMLLNRIEETGLLDDYMAGMKMKQKSRDWIECFSRDALVQIFTTFPAVYESCYHHMSDSLGPVVKDVRLFDDTFCNLFENVLEKAKNINLKHGWAWGNDTPEFHEFEFAISLLDTFLQEDSRAATRNELSLSHVLNKFADSEFVNLNNCGLGSVCDQLQKIKDGRCSAGFPEQLSRIYTALSLARTVLFYGNVIAKQQKEGSNCRVWDKCSAATFFKMKKVLREELEAPLYHGHIDTEATKSLLTKEGDYLARYSSNQKSYYFSVLVDVSHGIKNVQNIVIPPNKVETWLKNPLANREEIEGYIHQTLTRQQQSDKMHEALKQVLGHFLAKVSYSPVLNPLRDLDVFYTSSRAG